MTGCLPRPNPESDGVVPAQPRSSTHACQSSNVTSFIPSAKDLMNGSLDPDAGGGGSIRRKRGQTSQSTRTGLSSSIKMGLGFGAEAVCLMDADRKSTRLN